MLVSTVDRLSASTVCPDQELNGLTQTPNGDGDTQGTEIKTSTGASLTHMRDRQKYSARVDRHSASTRTRSWLLLPEQPVDGERGVHLTVSTPNLLSTRETQEKSRPRVNRPSTLIVIDGFAQPMADGQRWRRNRNRSDSKLFCFSH
jgi:hypothetical protein